MTVARQDIVVEGEAVYHCISRCVRRAYLCGFDVLTGKSFDHRKDWVRERLILLSEIFAIDVLGYALMSNHQHLILRTRPDLLGALSDREVAQRWVRLSGINELHDARVAALIGDTARLKVIRERLGSISWFMKSINEFIARRANKEDGCKGRFWEGRFKSQRLADEGAVLACSIYVDLNPIRAKIAKTPEESLFTGAYERIKNARENPKAELWLAPINDTPKRRGYLSMTLPEYLKLLDATGRELVYGKRGAIAPSLAPILERTGLRASHWPTTTSYLGNLFSHLIGAPKLLNQAARKLGKIWIKGKRAAILAYS